MAANRPVRNHHFRFDVGTGELWRLRCQYKLHLGLGLTDRISHVTGVFTKIFVLHIFHDQRAAELPCRMPLFGVQRVFGHIVGGHIVSVLPPRNVSGGGGVVGAVQFGGISDNGVDVTAMGVDSWGI